jgi:hypothetical protein
MPSIWDGPSATDYSGYHIPPPETPGRERKREPKRTETREQRAERMERWNTMIAALQEQMDHLDMCYLGQLSDLIQREA